jgi:hypothetical protein
MTRSNFDPDNPDRDPGTRGGLDRFLGPPARDRAAIPADMTDGEADDADAPEDIELSHEAQKPDAARALERMTEPHPGEEGTTSSGAH